VNENDHLSEFGKSGRHISIVPTNRQSPHHE